MISGTIYLSTKAKAALGKDVSIFIGMLDSVIEKATGNKASVGVADSVLAGAEASVNLMDVNNISGTWSDVVAAAVKIAVAKFFFKRSLMVNPFTIKVTTHGSNVV